MKVKGTLPECGKTVELRQLKIRESIDIEKAYKDANGTDIVIQKIRKCLETIDDVKVGSKEIGEFLDDLTTTDFACLCVQWEKINGINPADSENFSKTVEVSV
jgi:hypothetical protein